MEDIKLINFRSTAALARELATASAKAEVSQSQFVREAIKAHIERHKAKRVRKAA